MFAKPLLFQFLEAEHLRPIEFGHGSLAFSLRCNLPGLSFACSRPLRLGRAAPQNSPDFFREHDPQASLCNRGAHPRTAPVFSLASPKGGEGRGEEAQGFYGSNPLTPTIFPARAGRGKPGQCQEAPAAVCVFLFFLSVFFQSIHDGVCGFEPASKEY